MMTVGMLQKLRSNNATPLILLAYQFEGLRNNVIIDRAWQLAHCGLHRLWTLTIRSEAPEASR